MADSESSTILPDGSDAELIRLGEEYKELLRMWHTSSFDKTSPEDRFLESMLALEDRIAAMPARTLPGVAVRLWALWGNQCKDERYLFTGLPEAEADFKDRLVWGVLQDVERLAATRT